MLTDFITSNEIDQAVNVIKEKCKIAPSVGMVLGSGLGDLADMVEGATAIPYHEIPNWPVSTVIGHSGKLVIGRLKKVPVIVMQGRAHYYEGYPMDVVTMPIRVMQRLGVSTLILTNAAGAVNPDYVPGDVMVIADHIGLIGMVGPNPLRGPNLEAFGERFPDMSQPYDRELNALAVTSARKHGINLRIGVYICLSGPSFESPADLRFLRVIGADAVGMSTVPEVIVARHGGMRVLGLSGISNKANLDGSVMTTHEEVLEAGKLIVPKLKSIVFDILESLETSN